MASRKLASDFAQIRGARGVLVAVEFDVTAERYGGEPPARSVTIVEAEDLWPESDREGPDADPAPAPHQEVTELVHEDDDAEQHQHRDDICGQDMHHRHRQ